MIDTLTLLQNQRDFTLIIILPVSNILPRIREQLNPEIVETDNDTKNKLNVSLRKDAQMIAEQNIEARTLLFGCTSFARIY